MNRNITIASCQHPISGDPVANASWVRKLVRKAAAGGADIAHFPETNLSGYAGGDFREIRKSDYAGLQHELESICSLAGMQKIWIILGSHHFMEGMEKPYNCLYLISDQGKIAGRYDKRFMFGPAGKMEHAHYTSGKDPFLFELKGIKCGLLICHEWRYPELYREYHKLGAAVIFHSWYDANLSGQEYLEDGKETGELIMGYVRGNAANNYFWISGSNNSMKESSFPAFVVQPDGRIRSKLKRNRAGALITRIDMSEVFDDPSTYNRKILFERMNH